MRYTNCVTKEKKKRKGKCNDRLSEFILPHLENSADAETNVRLASRVSQIAKKEADRAINSVALHAVKRA